MFKKEYHFPDKETYMYILNFLRNSQFAWHTPFYRVIIVYGSSACNCVEEVLRIQFDLYAKLMED